MFHTILKYLVTFIIKIRLYIRNIFKSDTPSTLVIPGSKFTHCVKYNYRDNGYSIPIIIKRGPKKTITVYDHLGNDVTEKINPYIGANKNFHDIVITTKDLGYIFLKFIVDNREYIFFKHDTIVID